jgi:hypothetical protein
MEATDRATPIAHPDAGLIELCERHIANLHAHNNDPDGTGDADDPLLLAYLGTLAEVHLAKPKTLAGMIAKARAAMAEIDADADEDASPGFVWAREALGALVLLSGAGPTHGAA